MKNILGYRIIFAFLFIYVFILTGCNSQTVGEKQINVVFRFDDPSALSSTETELKVIDIFREHNVSLTFGVIPFKCAGSTRDTSPQDLVSLTVEKGDLLRKVVEEGIVDIALHGYSHQMREYETWTEFTGMDYARQLDKLSKGKKLLEEMIGTTVTTFIPPYNTYDLNTLKALEVLGFSILSAGIGGEVTNDSKLDYMPMTIRLHQIQRAVQQARASSDKQPLIVVMFHEYDFMDQEVQDIEKRIITFEELENHVSWLTSQNDVRVLSMNQANKIIDDLGTNRFRFVKLYSFFKPIIPGFLADSVRSYPEPFSVLTILVKVTMIYLLIMFVFMFVSYSIGCFIFRKSIKSMRILTFGSMTITILSLLYVSMKMEVNTREMAAIVGFFGFTIGSVFCLKSKNKRK